MTLLQAIVLGFIQGLTEFLPVSSSGHLVLASNLLHVAKTNDITFEVFVHFGTLLSVTLVFWKDIVGITDSTVKAFTGMKFSKEYYDASEHFRLGLLILLGSIPAAVIGIGFKEQIEAAFTDPKLVAVMLVVTGLILFLTRFAKPVEGKSVSPLSSVLIGVAQAFAILPGFSRSGSTISAALFLKVSPVKAARFSFLLSLPAVAGATIMKSREMIAIGLSSDVLIEICAGTIVAFITGYVAIKFLLKIVEKGKFSLFAYYCLIVGIIGIVFL
ncbi:MAG: undecaprenyl-diphosphate phosphatase [bacterium]